MTFSPSQIVGANVRAEMARRGMTQATLAEHVGVSQPGLSKRLRGVIAFDVNEIDACARALSVPVELLLATEPAA